MKKRVNTYLAIAITTYCNYQCFYCKKGGESISKERETISFDDVKKIIANAYANGIVNFRITGGEPTSVSYFCELIEYIMKFKDTKVRINTNGFRILEYIDAADMRDKVIFHGWCTGERKKNFYKMTDALIIPSLYEPFGYVALEAMTEGTPVISSNNGGLDEILAGYSYKYNPYADNELEETIERFMKDDVKFIDEQMDILIGNLKMFTAKRMTDEYHRLWRELSEDSI